MTKSHLKLFSFILCIACFFTACSKKENAGRSLKIKSITAKDGLPDSRIEFSYDGENLSEVKGFSQGNLQHIFRYTYNGAQPKQVMHYFYDQASEKERLRATINFSYAGDQLVSFEAIPTQEYAGALNTTYTFTYKGAKVPEMRYANPGSVPIQIPNVNFSLDDRFLWTPSTDTSATPVPTFADLMSKTSYDDKHNPLAGLLILSSMYLEEPKQNYPSNYTNYLATPFYFFDLEAYFLEHNKTHFAHSIERNGNLKDIVDISYTYNTDGYPTKSVIKPQNGNGETYETVYAYW